MSQIYNGMKSFAQFLSKMDGTNCGVDLNAASLRKLTWMLEQFKVQGDTECVAEVEKAIEKKLDKYKYWR